MAKSVWNLDTAHSLMEFSVKHMMISTVKGRFTTMEGQIVADPENIAGAEFAGSVDVASINTAEASRDDHLRSADFFDAANYPKITFKSTSVEPDGEDYKMTGDLTIRGVTRPVTFNLTFEGTGKDPWGNEKIGFSATTRISRKDFGLNWNAALETGGVLVGDQVKIELHLEANKQA